jgi:hypothetical protein
MHAMLKDDGNEKFKAMLREQIKEMSELLALVDGK